MKYIPAFFGIFEIEIQIFFINYFKMKVPTTQKNIYKKIIFC